MKLVAIFKSEEAFQPVEPLLKTSEVFSSEPYHPKLGPNGLLPAGVWGGVIGAVVGAAMAAGVFYVVNLRTGHMSIITFAPIGIILFGIAALFSITGVLIAFLREAGLLTTRLTLPEHIRCAMSHGAVAVTVDNATPELEESLQRAGARTEWLDSRP